MDNYKVIIKNRNTDSFRVFCYACSLQESIDTIKYIKNKFPEAILYAIRTTMLMEVLPMLIDCHKKVKITVD